MTDDIGKLILRVTLGVLILLHGIGKVTHGIAPIEGMVQGVGFPTVLALGVYLGEILGPLLLLIGYYVRVGAALIALNMLAAILLAHRQDILGVTPQGGWALELQGMYLSTAIALIFTGPGRISINQR